MNVLLWGVGGRTRRVMATETRARSLADGEALDARARGRASLALRGMGRDGRVAGGAGGAWRGEVRVLARRVRGVDRPGAARSG